MLICRDQGVEMQGVFIVMVRDIIIITITIMVMTMITMHRLLGRSLRYLMIQQLLVRNFWTPLDMEY